MKKIVYSILLTLVISVGLSACTEQDVKPKDGGTGAQGPDPKG